VVRPHAHEQGRRPLGWLALGALGVVYGDIGTSPLYAMRECFHGVHAIAPDPPHVYGILSLITWSLILVISVKYLALVLRADNRGEGGILALVALLRPESRDRRGAWVPVLAVLGLFGAALLYGDGMITPAISVLAAAEGLTTISARGLQPFVLPLTLGTLVALFLFQRHGTHRIASVFGPIMLVWFSVLAALGVHGIVAEPHILGALDPRWAVRFFAAEGLTGILVLGSVFLVVTGGEALYADMGHFGKRPIRVAWFALVLPALLLNYFGQGALLLRDATAVENPFYMLAPEWGRLPLVVLATAATIVASQAVISGAFSLTRQAVQLGYLPRVEIRHTSAQEIGQIYIPEVNMLLLVASVSLVLGFRSTSALAAAYGLAVTIDMAITTLLMFFVMRLWRWSLPVAAGVTGALLTMDLAFLSSNAAKVVHGGWFPLLVGTAGYLIMSTWRKGRELLSQRLRDASMPMSELLARLAKNPPQRVAGTAVFMSAAPSGVPPPLLQNLRHNRVLHERVVLLTIVFDEVPRVPEKERIELYLLEKRFYRVIAHYGFKEEPNVLRILELCRAHHLDVDLESTTFFLARESLLATERPGMALWRERLFALLTRNAWRPTAAFRIPAGRVVELGTQIEL
jgi:KUP system potassium uptake protein